MIPAKPTLPHGVFERYPSTQHIRIEGKGSNPAFVIRIGKFISASDRLFSDAWQTIFLFHKNAFRTNCSLFR